MSNKRIDSAQRVANKLGIPDSQRHILMCYDKGTAKLKGIERPVRIYSLIKNGGP